MDAGLTGLLGGVIGAAVGALGTTAGAWITGRKAEAQARIQADALREQTRQHVNAQLEQARLQVKASHYLDRREPRAQTYAAFVNLVIDLEKALLDASSSVRDDRDEAAERLDEATSRHLELAAFKPRVQIEGPRSVGIATRLAVAASNRVVEYLHHSLYDSPEWDDSYQSDLMHDLYRARDEFISQASKALGYDGTQGTEDADQ
ncbi:hypothetical protein AB0C96_23695 [Streptomyces sp. NPDC048506]|uniref:hypothetical protein n=1 Tax=Streptomyces sp. NPDC048506 TaxID=3155028 RepID=UPI0034205F93